MDQFLLSLKNKEKEIVEKLMVSPLYKQLLALRNTISEFEANGSNGVVVSTSVITDDYDSENMTWKERVLFVIKAQGKAGAAEIIRELQKREPNHSKAFLTKRVGVTVQQLKNESKISVQRIDKKNKYSLPMV